MKSKFTKSLVEKIKIIFDHSFGIVINPILNVDWVNVKISVYVRYIAMILLIVNSFLTRSGYNPIPISGDDVYEITSDILTAIVFILNTYKNNSTSKEAIEADKVLNELKEQKKELNDSKDSFDKTEV